MIRSLVSSLALLAIVGGSQLTARAERAPFDEFGRLAYRSQIKDKFSGVIVDRFTGKLTIHRLRGNAVRIRIYKPSSTIQIKFLENGRYFAREYALTAPSVVLNKLQGRWFTFQSRQIRAVSRRNGKVVTEFFPLGRFPVIASLRINPELIEYYNHRR